MATITTASTTAIVSLKTAFLKSVLFRFFLLIGIAALPAFAFAIDTDTDGVDDSVDAFPTKPEATIDTDSDGKPDSINYSKVPVLSIFYSDYFSGTGFGSGWTADAAWTVTSGYAQAKPGTTYKYMSRSVNVPDGGGILSFKSRYGAVSGGGNFYVDGVRQVVGMFTTSNWSSSYVSLSAGTHLVKWGAACYGGLSFCFPSPPIMGYIDDVVLSSPSTLVLDNCPLDANVDQLNTDGDTQGNVCDEDDDNDGFVDSSDAFPLNAAETLDTDLDGTGNNADSDDDNDSLPDFMDPLPLQSKFNLNASFKGVKIKEENNEK